MNYPLSVANRVPNNVLMQPLLQGHYDLGRAGKQWLSLYRTLSGEALVYVLPGHDDLQDLPFVANLACYLPHCKEPTVVISNFRSEPRKKEDQVGHRFFSSFDYQIHWAPKYFEGEADLKWVRGNIYVGGVGRSSMEAYNWMRDQFAMDIIPVVLSDSKLYHLDCVFLPLGPDKALVNTAVLSRQVIKLLEQVVEVVPVMTGYTYQGWTNCIRMGKTLLHAPADKPPFPFLDLLEQHDLSLQILELDEFDKSGADLSCLVMHMNYR